MQLPRLGPSKIARLVRADGLDDVYERPRVFLEQLGEAVVREIEAGTSRRVAERVCKQAEALGQTLIALGSPAYPASLAAIYDPPPVLFVRGSLSELSRRVAIVGSRGATGSGRSIARDLASGLARHGLEVVSGLARGVDGAAHEGALAARGRTLAVLGSSVDVVYPGEHKPLAARIESSGAVISELPPGTGPKPAQFPRRNRIIVGLVEAVIVVEAGARSGALITARLALDEGREVLAVPGRPGDPLAFGPNLMIRDGGVLIRGLDDVLEHLGIDFGVVGAALAGALPSPDPILEKLTGSAAKSIDQLTVETGLATPALMARLAGLELAGRIERLPGTLFRSASPA